QLLAEYDVQSYGSGPSRTTQFFAGNRVGQWTDRIGSARKTSTGVTSHYYPYGEEITGTANDAYKFGKLYRDSDSGLDYANQRYSPTPVGRFLTPNPAGMGTASAGDPASWNRYSYTQSDPVNFLDVSGLMREATDNGPCGPDWATNAG